MHKKHSAARCYRFALSMHVTLSTRNTLCIVSCRPSGVCTCSLTANKECVRKVQHHRLGCMCLRTREIVAESLACLFFAHHTVATLPSIANNLAQALVGVSTGVEGTVLLNHLRSV